MELHYCVRCSFRRWRPSLSLSEFLVKDWRCSSLFTSGVFVPAQSRDVIPSDSWRWDRAWWSYNPGRFTNSTLSQFANRYRTEKWGNNAGVMEEEETSGPRNNTVTGRISIPLERRCFIARKFLWFSIDISSTLWVSFSLFLFLYLSASRRYLTESHGYNIPNRNACGSICLTLGFPNCFRYCNHGCLSVTTLSLIRLLRKNEVVEPKWISHCAFTHWKSRIGSKNGKI